MAVSMIGPKFYAWDRNGKPLAFGKLYTYQARTNIPKPTYQSEDSVVENTNPVILNGEGYANVYLSGSYKMVLKDEKENEIWTSDPVTSPDNGSGLNYVVTAIYVSPSEYKAFGDHSSAMSSGSRVKLTSSDGQDVESTVLSTRYINGYTIVTVESPVVQVNIVTASSSNGVGAVVDLTEQGKTILAGLNGRFIGYYTDTPGPIFETLSDYVVFNGLTYKASSSVSLPYQVDSTSFPDPSIDTNLRIYSDINSITGDKRYTAIFKNEGGYTALENMIAGRVNGVESSVAHTEGNIYGITGRLLDGDLGAADYVVKVGQGDGYADHTLTGTLFAQILEDAPRIEQCGGFVGGDDISPIFNTVMPIKKRIIFQTSDVGTYNFSSTLYIGEGYKLLNANGGGAHLKINVNKYLDPLMETFNFRTEVQRNVYIENMQIEGSCYDFTTSEIRALTGDEGRGCNLTVGTSELNLGTHKTAGAGIVFDADVSLDLYTHGNILRVGGARAGQEGVVFNTGYDHYIKDVNAYLCWDSDRDLDFNDMTGKANKMGLSGLCAGVLFKFGSATVKEAHPNNNRFGYAFATDGQSGASYRLRFWHMIGEGSAGGAYFAYTDNVSGMQLNCHSTRGVYGLPLVNIRSGANVNIGTIDILVDSQYTYPDDGTYCALNVDGDRAVVDNCRIWATTGKVNAAAAIIKGTNHRINLDIYNCKTNEAGDTVSAITLAYPTTGLDLKAKITICGHGISAVSANVDVGYMDVTFASMSGNDINSTYFSNDFIRRCDLLNLDTGRSTKPVTIDTTIALADLNGVDKHFNINNTADFLYQYPTLTSFMVKGATSSYRQSDGFVYQTANTGNSATLRYKISGTGSDAIVKATFQ